MQPKLANPTKQKKNKDQNYLNRIVYNISWVKYYNYNKKDLIG